MSAGFRIAAVIALLAAFGAKAVVKTHTETRVTGWIERLVAKQAIVHAARSMTTEPGAARDRCPASVSNETVFVTTNARGQRELVDLLVAKFDRRGHALPRPSHALVLAGPGYDGQNWLGAPSLSPYPNLRCLR